MKTDELINVLAQDSAPAKRESLLLKLAVAGLAALGVCVLFVVFLEGVRPDFTKNAGQVALKATFSAVFAAAALPAAARLARPGNKVGVWVAVTFVIALVCVLISGFTFMPPEENALGGLVGGLVPVAFLIIPALATPAAIMIFAWYRQHAPTRLALAGASVGAMSGGLGAMAYALVCPVDDMGFVSVWYGAAIVMCTLVGALIGPRVLRW